MLQYFVTTTNETTFNDIIEKVRSIEETKLEMWLVPPGWDPLSTLGSKEEG